MFIYSRLYTLASLLVGWSPQYLPKSLLCEILKPGISSRVRLVVSFPVRSVLFVVHVSVSRDSDVPIQILVSDGFYVLTGGGCVG